MCRYGFRLTVYLSPESTARISSVFQLVFHLVLSYPDIWFLGRRCGSSCEDYKCQGGSEVSNQGQSKHIFGYSTAQLNLFYHKDLLYY